MQDSAQTSWLGSAHMTRSLIEAAVLGGFVLLTTVGSTLLGFSGIASLAVGDSLVDLSAPLYVACAVLLMALGPRIIALSKHAWLMPACTICLLVAMLLQTVLPQTSSVVLSAALSVLVVSATFTIEMAVLEALLKLSIFQARLVFTTCWIAGVFLAYCIPASDPLTFLVACVCYCVTAVAVPFVDRAVEERPSPVTVKRNLKLHLRPALGLLIIGFAAHFASGYMAKDASNTFPLSLLSLVLSLVLLWTFVVRRDEPGHGNFVSCLIILTGMTYLTAIGFPQWSDLTFVLGSSLGSIVWVGFILVALELCGYANANHLGILGGAYALLTAVPLVTLGCNVALRGSVDAFFGSTSFACVVVMLLIVAAIFLTNAQELNDLLWGTPCNLDSFVPQADDAENAVTQDQDAEPSSLHKGSDDRPTLQEPSAVDVLSERAGLSRREQEVLALLAAGRSVPFIAEDLYIERSTAKSHVAHIYRKLSVHSKQELLTLIESVEN